MKKVHFFTGVPLKHLEKTELDQMYWSNVIDSHNLITWSKIISFRYGSDWHLVITRNSLFTDLINIWRSFQRHPDATSKAGKKLYLLQFSILQYWFFKPRIDSIKILWKIVEITKLILHFFFKNNYFDPCTYACACACACVEPVFTVKYALLCLRLYLRLCLRR